MFDKKGCERPDLRREPQKESQAFPQLHFPGLTEAHNTFQTEYFSNDFKFGAELDDYSIQTSRPVPFFFFFHFFAATGAAAKKCTKQSLPYAENEKLDEFGADCNAEFNENAFENYSETPLCYGNKARPDLPIGSVNP